MHAHTPILLSVPKNIVPEVRATGRSPGEVEGGKGSSFPRRESAQRGLEDVVFAVPPLIMRPQSCPPPSASQLIVCSANTLVATRVTLIDERLEFKWTLKHQSVTG